MERMTSCCFAPFIDDMDICAKCRDHAVEEQWAYCVEVLDKGKVIFDFGAYDEHEAYELKSELELTYPSYRVVVGFNWERDSEEE